MEEDRAGKMTHVDGVILPENGARSLMFMPIGSILNSFRYLGPVSG